MHVQRYWSGSKPSRSSSKTKAVVRVEKDYKEVIGANLRRLIDREYETRSAFADAIDRHESTVSGWVRAEHLPSLEDLLRSSEVLDVPLPVLVGDVEASYAEGFTDAARYAARRMREAAEKIESAKGQDDLRRLLGELEESADGPPNDGTPDGGSDGGSGDGGE